MEIPDDLIDVRPMPALPDAPTVGQSRQIYWWRACYDGREYRIENGHGMLLARSDNWTKLCAELGWYPGRERPARSAATRVVSTSRAVLPAACDEKLDEILATGEQLVGLHKPKRALEQRPDPPEEGESVEIFGYRVTRRTIRIDLKNKNTRTYYYAYDQAGEIVSFAENWIDWCHQLNWFPRDDLDAGQMIPREAKPDQPPRPKTRSAPAVLNRHHYKTRDEIPEPWVYMGRGHPLGNPFVVVKDDPVVRSALADDPNNPEHRSSIDALTRYRRWLWEQLRRRNPEVLRELGKIKAETHLVCSCAPRPCHLDVVVRAWKWARGRTVLDGYGASDQPEPDWVTSSTDSNAGAGVQDTGPTVAGPAGVDPTSPGPAAPPAEDLPRPQPQNLDLFGGIS